MKKSFATILLLSFTFSILGLPQAMELCACTNQNINTNKFCSKTKSGCSCENKQSKFDGASLCEKGIIFQSISDSYLYERAGKQDNSFSENISVFPMHCKLKCRKNIENVLTTNTHLIIKNKIFLKYSILLI